MQDRINQPALTKLGAISTTCTCSNLRKAARAITQLYDEVLQPSGLLVNQFTLLVAIALAGSATITRLAQALVMDRTTLTRNLKPLVRQGLIEIEPGQDQRVRIIKLTDEGRTALIKALPLWEQAQSRVVKGLGQERWHTLLNNLSDTTSCVREV